MAYGVKYYCDHKTQVGGSETTARIEILEDGYSGPATEVRGAGDVYRREYERLSRREPFKNPILGGRMEFVLLVEGPSQLQILQDIFAADAEKYRMRLKIGGSVAWTGKVQTGLLDYSEDGYPFEGVISAKDLSPLDSPASSFGLQGGGQTIIQTISAILKKLGYGLQIATYTNWEYAAVAGGDYLAKITHILNNLREFGGEDPDTPITDWQALEWILRAHMLHLWQSGGMWHLRHVSALKNPQAVARHLYDQDGVLVSSGNVDLRASVDRTSRFILPSTRNIVLPALRQVRTRFVHRTRIATLTLPSKVTIQQNEADKSYTYNNFISDGSQAVHLSAYVLAYQSAGVTGEVDVQIRHGNRYYTGSTWSTTAQDIRTSLERGPDDQWVGSFSINTAPIPAGTGDLIITLRKARTRDEGGVGGGIGDPTNYTDIGFEILNPATQPGDTTAIVKTLTQTGDYLGHYDHGDVYFGDGPTAYSYARLSTITEGRTDGRWRFKGGSAEWDFHQLGLKEILCWQRTAVRTLSGELWGAYEPHQVAMHEGGGYLFLGGVQTGRENTWSADWAKIQHYDQVSDDFQERYETSDPGRGGGGGGGGGSPAPGTTTWGSIIGKPSSTSQWATETGFDDRYFRRDFNLSEGNPFQMRTNLGLHDGSADLDLRSLDVGSGFSVDENGDVVGRDFEGRNLAYRYLWDNRYARDLYEFRPTSSTHTGILRIKVPSSVTGNRMVSIEIKGYQYTTQSHSGGWTINVSGYIYRSSNRWYANNVAVNGEPPFTTVRGGMDSDGTAYLYLGDTDTFWNFPQIVITEILSRLGQSSNFIGDWEAEFVDSYGDHDDLRTFPWNRQSRTQFVDDVRFDGNLLAGSNTVIDSNRDIFARDIEGRDADLAGDLDVGGSGGFGGELTVAHDNAQLANFKRTGTASNFYVEYGNNNVALHAGGIARSGVPWFAIGPNSPADLSSSYVFGVNAVTGDTEIGRDLHVDRYSFFSDDINLDAGQWLDDDNSFIRTDTYLGGFAGSGFQLGQENGRWNLTVDNITARRRFMAYEFLLNQLRAGNGNEIFRSGMESGAVETLPAYTPANQITTTANQITWAGGVSHKVYGLEDLFVPFTEGELIRTQVFSGRGVKGAEATVLEVENGSSTVTDNSTARYMLISLDSGDDPDEGDKWVALGHETDRDRQGIVGIFGEEEGAPFMRIMDGVDRHRKFGSFDTLVGQFGRLDNITDPLFPVLDGSHQDTYGVWTKNVFLRDNVYIAFDGGVGKLGKDAGGPGNHGMQLNPDNYIYTNNLFQLGGLQGIRRGPDGKIRFGSDVVVDVQFSISWDEVEDKPTYLGSDRIFSPLIEGGTIIGAYAEIDAGDIGNFEIFNGNLIGPNTGLAGSGTWRLWVGSNTPGSANFRVNSSGKLFATGAEISGGKIEADNGDFWDGANQSFRFGGAQGLRYNGQATNPNDRVVLIGNNTVIDGGVRLSGSIWIDAESSIGLTPVGLELGYSGQVQFGLASAGSISGLRWNSDVFSDYNGFEMFAGGDIHLLPQSYTASIRLTRIGHTTAQYDSQSGSGNTVMVMNPKAFILEANPTSTWTPDRLLYSAGTIMPRTFKAIVNIGSNNIEIKNTHSGTGGFVRNLTIRPGEKIIIYYTNGLWHGPAT